MTSTSVASRRSREAAPPPNAGAAPAAATSVDGHRAERLLAIKLAATQRRRREHAAEIELLARTIDYDWFAQFLRVERLLPLLGGRLTEAAPSAVPPMFLELLEQHVVHARRKAALVEQVALRLVREIEGEGIPVVPLKGPHLAERVHGDAGLRLSNDIDLIVLPEDFHETVHVLGRFGYTSRNHAAWIDGLPLFEATLLAADDWHPPIDLHWRLHWYEEAFSRAFIRRAEPGAHGVRAPEPVDELAALLLFWARDGLWGLRHAADIAAWWDRHGAELEPCALDLIVETHPPLRRALSATALFAEQTIGVPADRLLSELGRDSRRTRAALRLGNLVHGASNRRREASSVLLDALVTPRGGAAAFVGRHLVLPPEVIAEVYGLPPEARGRRLLRRAYYAGAVGLELARGMAERLPSRP